MLLKKKSCLKIVSKISKILKGEVKDIDELHEKLTHNNLVFFKNVLSSFVDVKQSF